MRDFPVFTTENGVGSLVLREIPYSGIAYVTVQDSSFPTEFLNECVGFCRMAGASCVVAAGHEALSTFSLHTAVWQMRVSKDRIPETDAMLFPVTEKTISRWREIYNEKMAGVHNAAYMSVRAGRELLEKGNGYFVHRQGQLLGIGAADSDRIDCIASTQPGHGWEVVSALAHGRMDEWITLEVASTNTRAIRLYESMGFLKTREISRWYKIF